MANTNRDVSMNTTITRSPAVRLLGLLLATSFVCSALATGNIDVNNKYAWSENAGWVNFGPTNAGVTVVASGSQYLSGYAWAENIGWVKLGNANGGPYQNTGASDWGVNIINKTLAGFAWSENCGWIRFNPTNSPVTINWSDGTLSGYAWSENVGWVHMASLSAYGVQTTARACGTMLLFR